MRHSLKSDSSYWKICFLVIGLSITLFSGVFLKSGFNEQSIRINIRLSAKISLVCFCVAFSASSLYVVYKSSFSQWLLVTRKYFGVSFAMIHLIHLFFLILLHHYFHPVFILRPPITIALGGLAYLFLVLMLLTSFERISNFVSRNTWKRIHLYGGYWILIVFSNSIYGRVIAGHMGYLPLAIILTFVWVIRILSKFNYTQKSTN